MTKPVWEWRRPSARSVLVGLLVLFLAVGMVAPAMGALTTETTDPADVAFDGDSPIPNLWADDDLTKATHRMEWGDSHEAFEHYEDDGGDVVEPADSRYTVNTTRNDQTGKNDIYEFQFSDIEEDEYHLFPRDTIANQSGDSILHANDWVKGGQNSSELTVENSTTAPGVEAVRFHTTFNGNGGSTVAHANFSEFDLDSDETKRVVMAGFDADVVTSGATFYINVTDEDGDYVSLKAGDTFDETNHDVIFDSTGDTKIVQEKISNLTVHGSGDGTINNLEHVNVTIRGGAAGNDVDVSMFWFDAEKKGVIDLYENNQDTDSDDDLETVTHQDVQGQADTYSLSTLPSMFDDAVLHDVTAPVQWQAQLVQAGDLNVSYENSSDPSYDKRVTYYVDLIVPAQIDFTHSNLEIRGESRAPSDRYVSSQVAEDVDEDDTNFSEASYSDFETTLSSVDEGDEVDVDTTVGTDQHYYIRVKFDTLSEEFDALFVDEDDDEGAVVVDDGGSDGGGIWGFLTSLPGMILSGVAGLLTIGWLKRSGSGG